MIPLCIKAEKHAYIQSGLTGPYGRLRVNIILNTFGQPTLHGSIEYNTVLKLLTVKKCGACYSALDFCSP